MSEVVSSKNAIRHSACERFLQRVWAFTWIGTCRWTPWFARKWRIAWIQFATIWHRGGGTGISWKCAIASSARIDYPWKLSVAGNASIGEFAWIQCQDVVEIGENVCIGEYARVITGSHDITSTNFDLETKPVRIMNSVWIATGATILQGVTIGVGAVVAAGAVVTKDVEPWTVVGGNPAKFIKKREVKA